jgi:hypothetical protein
MKGRCKDRLILNRLFKCIVWALLQRPVWCAKVVGKKWQGYYLVQPDYRECASPFCGGYWLRQPGVVKLKCAGGERQENCYVATIDWDALGLSDGDETFELKAHLVNGQGLLRGEIILRAWDSFELGEFVVKQAFAAATNQEPRGKFYALRNSGIVCKTYPCYSVDEHVLNRKRVKRISDVDLSRVNATARQLDKASRAIANRGLVPAGRNLNVPDDGPAGKGIAFEATQFYLRV